MYLTMNPYKAGIAVMIIRTPIVLRNASETGLRRIDSDVMSISRPMSIREALYMMVSLLFISGIIAADCLFSHIGGCLYVNMQ